MGRSPCCNKVGLKKGPWTLEEDQKLLAYLEQHGHGSWRALPAKAGLQRCGKSCRLRWINYLRPDIKRGKFSLQEEQTIIQLHALLGNRWSAIATHLPKRTDNEIKNYWNTHLKKRLSKMGIDPVTHKPKADTLGSASGNPKDAANLSHMAQWESARLEAEARAVRESKLVAPQLANNAIMAPPRPRPQCLDVLKAWQGVVSGSFSFNSNENNLQSPTSTLNFMENMLPNGLISDDFVGNSSVPCGGEIDYCGGNKERLGLHEMASWFHQDSYEEENLNMESYSDMMVWDSGDDHDHDHHHHQQQQGSSMAAPGEILNETNRISLEENKDYWNSILNLVS